MTDVLTLILINGILLLQVKNVNNFTKYFDRLIDISLDIH